MQLMFQPLEGQVVRLEPFDPSLQAEVRAAIDCDPETWAIMPSNPTGAGFENFWTGACARVLGRMFYAIRRRADGRVVGITGYDPSMASQGGVEIGGTFLHPDVRGAAVNPESKLLLLAHAFDSGAVRVQFSVDLRNQRSQAAIRKLGAVKEGVLRRHRMTWTGHIRDTVVFSILDHEWRAVQRELTQRLARFG
jgi:N-acetyltransferase